jgi:hypothetical protein
VLTADTAEVQEALPKCCGTGLPIRIIDARHQYTDPTHLTGLLLRSRPK